MERKFDLIKKILLKVESGTGNTRNLDFQGYSKNEVLEHVELLIEAKFLRGKDMGMVERYWTYLNLTWEGHEFLDLIIDEKAVSNMFGVLKGHLIDKVPYEFIKRCLLAQLDEKVIESRKRNF